MIIAIAFLVGFILVYGIAIYNSLISQRNKLEESASGILVQLKRRADLVPNLVDTVKGYASHESGLLQKVVELRNASQNAKTIGEHSKVEHDLGMGLKSIFALSENYPDLKANASFVKLQEQIQEIEDELQMARRYYNATVRVYNTTGESFPANLISGSFGFSKREYFELENQEDDKVPTMKFW